MEERTQKLLSSIIKEYIRTAEPVSSKLLVDKYKLGVSPATVRNEMVYLEQEGYIAQPHTSAGRVPTEKGYQFYIENFLEPKNIKKAQNKALEKLVNKPRQHHRDLVKNLAREIAENSGQMIFVGFGDGNFYYTGVSNIFSQPEFIEQEMIHDLSRMIDHFEEAIQKSFNLTDDEVRVMVGSSNPFNARCSTVVVNYDSGEDQGVFGLLGPMRMDYDENMALVEYIKKIINNIDKMEEDKKKSKVDDEVQALNEELNPNAEDAVEETEEVVEDYKAKWMRAVADYHNLQKQTVKDKEDWAKYANAALVLELLPVVNHFKEAMKHIPEDQKNADWVEGVVQIKKQFDDFLQKLGIEEIQTIGEQFNPERHEAVGQREEEGKESDEVIEEVQSGYSMHGKIIEPAKVIVSK